MVKIGVHLRKLSQNEIKGSIYWNTRYIHIALAKLAEIFHK